MTHCTSWDFLEDFDIIPHVPPADAYNRLVFLRDYLPTIRVKYSINPQDNTELGLFHIRYPQLPWISERDDTIVEDRQHIHTVVSKAYNKLLSMDDHIAWTFGCESSQDAQRDTVIQELLAWFNLRDYMEHFEVEPFFGGHYYEKLEQHMYTDDSSSTYHLETFAYKVFHETIHAVLKNNFDMNTISTTPTPWIVSILQDEVIEKVSAAVQLRALEIENDPYY